MKICLITPPSVFLLDERMFMNLGILKIGAVLEIADVPLGVLDLSGIANYEEVVADYCQGVKTEIFGITSTTPQLPAAIRILNNIRQYKPKARVILGGPHITLVNAAFKMEKRLNINGNGRAAIAFKQLAESFDILVAGDGEKAIFQTLETGAPDFIDADNPQSPLFLSDDKLNQLPFPARHLVDVDSYHYRIDGVRALSLIAQLGCPFECGFCGGRNSPFLRRVRSRDSEHVVAEMTDIYYQYGIRGFMMYDDELNVSKEMVNLMKLIKQSQERLGVEFRLRGFIKAELFTEEQAETMYQAGFRWILVGFESGSPRILKNINKKSTREENSLCLEIARKHGLKVKALMSIGHPGETRQTIEETTKWLIETRPDDFDVSIITTYPGTPYYDEAVSHPDQPGIWVYTYKKTGDKLFSQEIDYRLVADYYKGDPDGGYVSFVHTEELSAQELVEQRNNLERRVRDTLGLPFNSSAAAQRYEHTMGQSGLLIPSHILKSTSPS